MKLNIKKLNENAILPKYASEEAAGLDLYCIEIHKVLSDKVVMYKTGLSVQPEKGYHTEILLRSSIVKSGYMLSNSVGLIDRDYTGELIVVLTKINENSPELSLPFCLTQLVVRKTNFFEINEVDILEETIRGDGGFGSTN